MRGPERGVFGKTAPFNMYYTEMLAQKRHFFLGCRPTTPRSPH